MKYIFVIFMLFSPVCYGQLNSRFSMEIYMGSGNSYVQEEDKNHIFQQNVINRTANFSEQTYRDFMPYNFGILAKYRFHQSRLGLQAGVGFKKTAIQFSANKFIDSVNYNNLVEETMSMKHIELPVYVEVLLSPREVSPYQWYLIAGLKLNYASIEKYKEANLWLSSHTQPGVVKGGSSNFVSEKYYSFPKSYVIGLKGSIGKKSKLTMGLMYEYFRSSSYDHIWQVQFNQYYYEGHFSPKQKMLWFNVGFELPFSKKPQNSE